MRNLIFYFKMNAPLRGTGGRVRTQSLQGDGSDRRIYRVRYGSKTCILVYHPGGRSGFPSENESFYRIGSHLRFRRLPSPKIYHYDRKGGRFLLEDFGDQCLQEAARGLEFKDLFYLYNNILELLFKIQMEGSVGFDPGWCHDTPVYDGAFSWNRESLYFHRTFVEGYLGKDLDDRSGAELREIAGRVDEEKTRLFLYRDFQSRNLMIRESGFGLIDFQGGRLGPPQYDLASLLIDPYVELPPPLQEDLARIYGSKITSLLGGNQRTFMENYRVIGFQRNLQMLGAFGFLTRVKGKPQFARSISPAVQNLKRWVRFSEFKPYRNLRRFVEGL